MITDARRRGGLRVHDTRLGEAIELLARWVSNDRALRGDAHTGEAGAEAASEDDAWLTIGVVGALLIRLARQMH